MVKGGVRDGGGSGGGVAGGGWGIGSVNQGYTAHKQGVVVVLVVGGEA